MTVSSLAARKDAISGNNLITQITMAEKDGTRISQFDETSGEPIAKCLYPVTAEGKEPAIWDEYSAWCTGNEGVLHVKGKLSIVSQISWLTDEVIEIFLRHGPA